LAVTRAQARKTQQDAIQVPMVPIQAIPNPLSTSSPPISTSRTEPINKQRKYISPHSLKTPTPVSTSMSPNSPSLDFDLNEPISPPSSDSDLLPEEDDIEIAYEKRLKRKVKRKQKKLTMPYYSGYDQCPINQTATLTYPMIREQQEIDPYYKPIIEKLTSNKLDNDTRGFYYLDDILFKQHFIKQQEYNLCCIPEVLAPYILFIAHTAPFSAHAGFNRVYQFIKERYYIRNLSVHVKRYIKHCESCQYMRVSRTKPQGYNKSMWPENYAPNAFIYIDHISPLRVSDGGHRAILTIIDRATRFAAAYPCKSSNATDTAKALCQYIYTYSCPQFILSDNSSTFQGSLHTAVCNMIGAKPVYASPYHPESNHVERLNQDLIHQMKHSVSPSQKNWHLLVAPSLCAYNFKYQSSLRASPFVLMHGYMPILPKLEQITPLETIEMRDYYERFQLMRGASKNNMITSLYKTKHYADQKRSEPTTYSLGQEVLIFFPRKTTRGPTGNLQSAKWKASYKGPYKILECRPPLNYRVELCHPFPGKAPHTFVTHVDRMKPFYRHLALPPP
jgi:hypothetical protein